MCIKLFTFKFANLVTRLDRFNDELQQCRPLQDSMPSLWFQGCPFPIPGGLSKMLSPVIILFSPFFSPQRVRQGEGPRGEQGGLPAQEDGAAARPRDRRIHELDLQSG